MQEENTLQRRAGKTIRPVLEHSNQIPVEQLSIESLGATWQCESETQRAFRPGI